MYLWVASHRYSWSLFSFLENGESWSYPSLLFFTTHIQLTSSVDSTSETFTFTISCANTLVQAILGVQYC